MHFNIQIVGRNLSASTFLYNNIPLYISFASLYKIFIEWKCKERIDVMLTALFGRDSAAETRKPRGRYFRDARRLVNALVYILIRSTPRRKQWNVRQLFASKKTEKRIKEIETKSVSLCLHLFVMLMLPWWRVLQLRETDEMKRIDY